MRLQVYLAHCGVSSRRGAQKIIEDGRVTINGIVATGRGDNVEEGDTVALDGKVVTIEERLYYVLLNKPAGYVCSLSDEKGRPVARDLIKIDARLYNVGRLDMYSEGLILFTNDGNLAKLMMSASHGIEKEYQVDTTLPIPPTLPEEFQHGMRVEDVYYKAKRAVLVNSHRLRVTLIEGKNRELRVIFQSIGVGIKRLTRVRIGGLTIGTLKSGEYRELSPQEVRSLYSPVH